MTMTVTCACYDSCSESRLNGALTFRPFGAYHMPGWRSLGTGPGKESDYGHSSNHPGPPHKAKHSRATDTAEHEVERDISPHSPLIDLGPALDREDHGAQRIV